MRFPRFLFPLFTLFASCTAAPAFAQTAAQVSQYLDHIDSASKAIRTMLQPPPVVVTPPKDTVVTPAVSSSYSILTGDTYASYASTAALQANISKAAGGTGGSSALYSDGLNGALVELDKSVLYNGHATAKYNQPAGQGTVTPQLYAVFPHTLTKAWLRFVVRFSPGWTTVGVTPANAANAYKLVGWGFAGTDGSGRIEFTNTNQYTLNWQVVGANVASTFQEANGPSTTTEWTDGGWYVYIVYYEQTSSTTVRERWWMGKVGTVPTLRNTVTGIMTTGTVPPLNRVMVGMNINKAPATAQSINWGEWSVVDGSLYANPYGLSGL